MKNKFSKKEIENIILRKLESHPGDAPWSCVKCYHNEPCIEAEILHLALKAIRGINSE